MCGEANQIYTYDWRNLLCRITVISSKISLIYLFAFQHLFHKFNEPFSQTCFFHGYRLYAVDGSDIHIPTIPDDYDTNFSASADSNGYNLIHLNTLYDLMNRRYGND